MARGRRFREFILAAGQEPAAWILLIAVVTALLVSGLPTGSALPESADAESPADPEGDASSAAVE